MNTATEKLQLDSTLIQQWIDDGVDYNQEFATSAEVRQQETSTTSLSGLGRFIDNFGRFVTSEPMQYFSFFVLIVLLGTAITYFISKKFTSPDVYNLGDDEEDNIYAIDFDKELEAAKREGNSYQCIRLTFLKLLRYLQDRGQIHWLPGKTVTQYNTEVGLDDFCRLSLLFVRIRYGNYPATQAMADEAYALASTVEKAVSSRTNNSQTTQP